jgi:hypothetical protein
VRSALFGHARFLGFYIPNMGVRLIALRNCDELVSVSKELGKRAWGYVLYDGPRRVLLASQSVSALAAIVQQLVRIPGNDFDPVLDHVYSQGLYNAVNGAIQKRYHKTWRIERVALQDLPQRFTELQADGYRRSAVVASSEPNWVIRRGAD